MNDAIASKSAELRDWLQRTRRMHALSGDGWIPLHLAAEALGTPPSVMRRMMQERTAPLRFRPMGGRERHRWQVQLVSIAAYAVAAEHDGSVN